MKIIEIILEGHRQPIVMFHGTTSTFLRSIMANGMTPNPEKRTWETDPHANASRPSRASLPGSYWASNLMTAVSSAGNTVRKFGGNRLYICASLKEQSAFADEDSIDSKISRAYGDTMGHFFPGVITGSEAVHIHLSGLLYKPGDYERAKKLFAENLHKTLSGTERHPIDYPMLGKIFQDCLIRMFVYQWPPGHARDRWLEGIKQLPEFPSPEQSEQQYMIDREWLTKRYRHTAYKGNDVFMHTLRMPNSIGFRGNNRIICIIEDIRDADGNTNLYLRYGSVPDDFIAQWTERVGKWPGTLSETRKLPGPRVAGSGKDFRQNAGTNRSKKQPGRLMGSGKAMKVKPGFVG